MIMHAYVELCFNIMIMHAYVDVNLIKSDFVGIN